ncbi:MAG: hypothetical protein ACM3U1_09545 [Chloroflexota bacterium]
MRRSYIIVAIAALSLVASCSFIDRIGQEFKRKITFTKMQDYTPSRSWKLDLKTKYLDKFTETGTKNGSIAYFEQMKWSKVVEFDENYTVWIKDLTREDSFGETTVTFTLELQAPAAVFEGEALKKRIFKITYDMDDSLALKKSVEADVVAQRFRRYAERCKRAGEITAYVNNLFLKETPNAAAQISYRVINWCVGKVTDEDFWAQQQFEAVACGAEVYAQVKDWLWQKENYMW